MSERQPPRDTGPGRRLLTCYHEAGHCLARWWFGHFFDRVLVLTAEEVARGVQHLNRRGVPITGAEGFMDCYSLVSPLPAPDLLDNAEGEPGFAAQVSHNMRVSVEMSLIETYAGVAAEARYRKCSFLWAMLTGGEGDLAHTRQTLDAWFPTPEARNTAAFAAERRAMALVRSEAGWQAITALANALMERGELQWTEAEPLLSAGYGCARPALNAWMESWPPSFAMIRNGRFPAQEAA